MNLLFEFLDLLQYWSEDGFSLKSKLFANLSSSIYLLRSFFFFNKLFITKMSFSEIFYSILLLTVLSFEIKGLFVFSIMGRFCSSLWYWEMGSEAIDWNILFSDSCFWKLLLSVGCKILTGRVTEAWWL